MQQIMIVIGTRPEAIKMLPVVRALRARGLKPLVVTTGQHRSMIDQVFAAFGEAADRDLALMTGDRSLGDLTAGVLQAMGRLFAEQRPGLVLVHGDTSSAMAAALASYHAGITVGHVEAGLRSHDPACPFPEEFNRIAIDAVADLLFAPTDEAAANLRRESPRERAIFVTGNTGIDALLHVAGNLRGDELEPLALPIDGERRLVLVTAHRRESFGGGFEGICEGIARVAARGDVELVYPVHLNPQVQELVRRHLAGRRNVHLIEPVDYVTMVALMQRACFILTDSGGIQEEAPALGRPVLVMREVTERPEAIASGAAILVGTDPGRIESEAARLLDDPVHYGQRARPVFPFGDGTAAARIAGLIRDYLNDRR